MTEQEKKMLNYLIEVGMKLNTKILEIEPDVNKCFGITYSPEDGYVSANFVKDGIAKCANRFAHHPEISYYEVNLDGDKGVADENTSDNA